MDGSLGRRLGDSQRLNLLVVNELGHMPMGSRQANLSFQLVSARYERGSIGVTTNKVDSVVQGMYQHTHPIIVGGVAAAEVAYSHESCDFLSISLRM